MFCSGTFDRVERDWIVDEVDVWSEAAVVALVRSVGFEGEVELRQPFTALSENITPSHWFALRDTVNELVAFSHVDGVVVVVGTDTLTFAAAALDFLLHQPFRGENVDKPVVVTGALRPALSVDSDAANNLGCAISAASALPAGVYVSFGGGAFEGANVMCATRVRKVGGSDPFVALGVPPVAVADVFGGVSVNTSWGRHWETNRERHPFDNYFGDNPSKEEIDRLCLMEGEWLAEPVESQVALIHVRSMPGANYELYRDMVRSSLDAEGCPVVHVDTFPGGTVPDGVGGPRSIVGLAEWCGLHDVPVVATLPTPLTGDEDMSLYVSSQKLNAHAAVTPTMLSEVAAVKAILLGSFMGGGLLDDRLFRLLFVTPFRYEFMCFK